MATAQESRVFGLDALRAAAILSVVLAHGGLPFVLIGAVNDVAPPAAPYTGWFFLLGHGGAIGVELFFVLSGFLIGGILLRAAESIGTRAGLLRFYVRRWFRTLPLFALALAANVIFERYFHHHVLTAGEIAGHGFFLRNFAHISLSFFPESWSLAVEEWFYLLFPAVLAVALKLSRARFARVFVVCATAFFVFSLAARTWGALQPGSTWAGNQRCTVIYRFDALMTGVVAAWLAMRFPAAWRRTAGRCAIAGVAIFGAAYAAFWIFHLKGPEAAPDSFFAKTFRFNFISLGIALWLPFLSVWTPRTEGVAHVAVRKIALWSYALYLVHWPLFQLAGAPVFEAWQKTTAGALSFYVGKTLVAIGLAALLYHVYERPCMRLRDRIRFRTAARSPSAVPARADAG
jgi:peptidoglycan/LPS O-acetylase OafA/YrhL